MQNRKLNIRIEVDFSNNGKKFLQELRKNDDKYKYCRIKDVLQALPSKVEKYKSF